MSLVEGSDTVPEQRPTRSFNRKRRKRGSSTAPKRIEDHEKAVRAIELRKAGSTYRQIAQVVGYYDAGAAHRAVTRLLAKTPVEPVEDLRTLQLERLNHMLLPLWPKVQAGDERSIDTALRVMQRMDQLAGTEAPAQVNVHHEANVLVIDGERDSFIARMKQMAGEVIDVQEHTGELPPGSPA